ncbi:MAG TPA: hypothetical protein VM656_13185 [Pyrinomonadaceae bacterium]|jgi:hypothetical protein|nr:hypothetical protein [Pyrinomonadaceae bacterium]
MKNRRALYLTVCAALCLLLGALSVQAQTTNTAQAETKDDETNLETQLYLILGTNQDVADAKMPTSLDSVVKELRAALPFKNYRLAATLINRVKNDSRLQLSWVGGTLASATPNTPSLTPSFSQFNVRQVRMVRNNAGQSVVQMLGFNFGARIPIQVSSAIAANGAVAPAYNYENTGLATDISMRESEPVIVGTMNIGPSGDAIILVVAAKRSQK